MRALCVAVLVTIPQTICGAALATTITPTINGTMPVVAWCARPIMPNKNVRRGPKLMPAIYGLLDWRSGMTCGSSSGSEPPLRAE